MLRNITLLTLAGFTAFSVSNAAFAANLKAKGFYLEGNAGYGFVNEKVEDTSRNTDGFTGNVNFGYKFSQNWATEIGALYFPNERFNGSPSLGSFNGRENYGFDLAMKGIAPFHALGSMMTFFAKLGLAVMHHKLTASGPGSLVGGNINQTRPAVLFGMGFGYAITANLETTVQGMFTTKSSDVPPMYGTTLGLTYIF